MKTTVVPKAIRSRKRRLTLKAMRVNWDLYVMLLLPVAFIIIFKYVPMYGAQIAFRNYSIFRGIWESEWVGLANFQRLFESAEFVRLLRNTIVLSFYNLLLGFPFPVLLAIGFNYIKTPRYKKIVQLTTYAPHFISTTVMVGIILQFLSSPFGFINLLRTNMGLQAIDFMANASYFPHIYVFTNIWQGAGYASIIYLAALSGIDPNLHEAAIIDGASKFRRVWHIDLPGITPTIVILFTLNMGSILNSSFEKIYLMQNPLNLQTSEVIDTYVYKIGLAAAMPNYSYPTAIGLFQSLVGIILIMTVNNIAKRLGETSLW